MPQSQESGVAKVKLQYMVDILSGAKLSHPFSLPQFTKGISIIFLFRGERENAGVVSPP